MSGESWVKGSPSTTTVRVSDHNKQMVSWPVSLPSTIGLNTIMWRPRVESEVHRGYALIIPDSVYCFRLSNIIFRETRFGKTIPKSDIERREICIPRIMRVICDLLWDHRNYCGSSARRNIIVKTQTWPNSPKGTCCATPNPWLGLYWYCENKRTSPAILIPGSR
jgi:hypothetical protein